MKYYWEYNDGTKKELTKEECYEQIEVNTRLDETMIRICLASSGVKHPLGRWYMER